MIILLMTLLLSVNFYPDAMMVVDVTEDEVVLEAANGNLFSMTSEGEDWEKGDIVAVILNDNGTEVVYDDEIVSAKYAGYTELFEDIERSEK